MLPRISVCLPTFNRRPYLQRTLDTLWAQRFEDFELLIADDGSTDDTLSYLSSIRDSRVRMLQPAGHCGWPGVINRLLEAAATEFVAICHDHDLYEPMFFRQCIAALDRYPAAAFAFTGCVWIDERERTIATHVPSQRELLRSGDFLRRLILRTDCPVCASSVVVRRKHMRQVGTFDPAYGLYGDVDFYARLAIRAPVVFVREPMVRVRVWSKQEATIKAGWIPLRINRAIRLAARCRAAEAGYPAGRAWILVIRGRYAWLIVRQALALWIRREQTKLARAGDELGLGRRHPLRWILRALAASTRIGGRIGRIRSSVLRGVET